ncbi:MAG: hypothetical protein JST17_15420 [Bacteroidetes bacterium]|nr:hypothetical protein [Bacteroidota bacterium]MBS1930574.1 hypothetical protein [Bacteroidota bacterium]
MKNYFSKMYFFKAILLFLSGLQFSLITNAQSNPYPVSIQVNVVQPVPPYLPQLKADLTGQHYGQLNQDINSHVSAFITSHSNATLHIKLSASIERVSPSPMGVKLRPDYQPSSAIIMNPQQSLVLDQQLLQNAFGNFNENSLLFENLNLSTLRQDGVNFKLPEGMYRICIAAYDYDQPGYSVPLSAPGTGCAYFTICYTASAPQFILPVSTMLQTTGGFQSFTPHSSQIQFAWTPPATSCGIPLGALTYDLEIRQVFPGQTILDAINNPFVFIQHNIPATIFLLDTLKYSNILIPGKQYITRVKANFTPMPGSPLEIANQGYSQIGAFAYNSSASGDGSGISTTQTLLYTPSQGCTGVSSVSNKNDLAVSDLSGANININGFAMHIDNATKNTDGSYKGNGYIIWHPLVSDVRLKVSFEKLKVNTDKTVYDGDAITSTDGSHPQWSPFSGTDPLSEFSGLNNDDYNNIKNRITNGAYLINEIAGNSEVDFPLGINNTNGMPGTLTIMGIDFSSSCTNMTVLLDQNLPELGGWLSLGGTHFQIAPDKLLLTDKGGILYLYKDQKLQAGNMQFDFNSCKVSSGSAIDTANGTYIAWDGINGLDKIVANADLIFNSKNSIVAVDKDDKQLNVPFSVHAKFSFTDWNDWVADITLPHNFEIASLPGFMLSSPDGIYDHSEKNNPSGINFPTAYTGAKDNSWEGLYFQNLKMSLPSGLTGNNNTSFGFQNFILDNTGVTTNIGANNILDINSGNIGGWAFSIDNINIAIVQNNFQNGMKMTGSIRLPISNDALGYSCNLSVGEGTGMNYQFVIAPKGNYNVDMWGAVLSLQNNSSLTINNNSGSFIIAANLNGNVSINTSKLTSGLLPNMNITALSFQGMYITNNDPNTHQFNFKSGVWSLGSNSLGGLSQNNSNINDGALAGGPNAESINNNFNAPSPDNSQNTVAGFGINISNFKFDFTPKSTSEFEAGILFDLSLNLGFGDNSVLSGTTNLGLIGKINIPSNGSATASFDRPEVNKIALKGGIGPVSVDGELDFIRDDKTYGNGINGTLHAKFPFAELDATARFGTTLDNINYWAVGGSIFMQAGIVIGPGLTVNGFGGGIYHNMTLTPPNDDDIRSHSTTPGTIPMIPQSGTTGIQAQLIVAVVQPVVVNASLTLSVEIHNGGLGKMELDGNGFVMSDPPSNDNALGSAYMKMVYDFENKIFDTYIDLSFRFLTASANAPIWMHGGPDGDYVYIGRPDEGEDKKVSLALINIGSPGDDLYVYLGASAYFDAGTELPPFPPLPSEITGYNNSSSNNTVFSILQENQETNPGFMFGARADGHLRLSLAFLYAQVDAVLGFDVALLHIDNPPAGCSYDGTFGLNKWYGMGDIYAYLDLDIGIHVDAWFANGDFELIKFQISADLQAGLPNPTWVDGQVHVKGSIFDGLVSVDGDFPFSFGEKCYIPFNPLDKIRMVTSAGPENNADVFDYPYATFSVPMNGTDFAITVPPDKNHDRAYDRHFSFYVYNANLYKIENDGSDSLVSDNIHMSDDGYSSTIVYYTMLQPYTRYKVYLNCYAKETINGQTGDPAEGPVSQDTTLYFSTGAAPDVIVDKNVDYAYPIPGQQFFLKNEFGATGRIELGDWQYNILPAQNPKVTSLGSGYSYEVWFIPDGAADTIKTNFTLENGNRELVFPIPPSLENNKIYTMEVWVIPHQGMKFQELVTQNQTKTTTITDQRQVQQMNNQGQLVQTTVSNSMNLQLTTKAVSKKPKTVVLGSIPLYVKRFQTSKYNSFSDKIAAYGQWQTNKENAVKDIDIFSNATDAEQFDEFEVKGFQSNCTTCKNQTNYTGNYPPLFSVSIPWNSNLDNDKFGFDKLYSNLIKLGGARINVNLGAPEVRGQFFQMPENAISMDIFPYQPKLKSLAESYIAKQSELPNAQMNAAVYKSQSSVGSSGSSGNAGFLSGNSMIGIPASYVNNLGNTNGSSSGSQNTLIAKTSYSDLTKPTLIWKRDEYIFADFQLFTDFANNFINDQSNTVYSLGGNLPIAYLNALNNNSDVIFAAGPYGTISTDPYDYLNIWNDPAISGLANNLNNLQFKSFPPTAGRAIQFNYSFPFGKINGSSVSQQFNYQSFINIGIKKTRNLPLTLPTYKQTPSKSSSGRMILQNKRIIKNQ